MSLATAAAVATAVAAVASAGVGAASAAGAFDSGAPGGGGAPQTAPLKAFAPATGLQGWAARLLATNVDAVPPTLEEWSRSGGTARFPLDIPDFTPKEAEQLRLVDKRGGTIPYYQEGQGALTDEQVIAIGQDRARRRQAGDLGDSAPTSSEEKFAMATNRANHIRNVLSSGGLAPGRASRLNKKLGKVEGRLDMYRSKR